MDTPENNALVLFWSAGGNTRRVAQALSQGLTDAGCEVDVLDIGDDPEVDYLDYGLVCVGAPVYRFLPPQPVQDFLATQQSERVEVAPAAPEKPGHAGVVFCTYGGPHTGVREAVPALKYMGQFLEHAGIRVVEEWPVVGEFHHEKRRHMNVEGRLGDIRRRPNEADIKDIRQRSRGLVRRLQHKLD
jgi:flavodoxin